MFRRYTDLPSLIHILTNKQLTLLDPATWDDKNDSAYLSEYKKRLKLKTVVAMCFATGAETYHHWKVFSPGTSGVCVILKDVAVNRLAKDHAGMRFERMKYLTIKALKSKARSVSELPFVKRNPFKPESEWRLLWESSTEEVPVKSFKFSLNAIESIVLSPWMHTSLAKDTIRLLKGIHGCSNLSIKRTTLINNDEWVEHGRTGFN